jgi:hypothetical protein
MTITTGRTLAQGQQDLISPSPPVFDNIEDERQHRKERLAGALRLFVASVSQREWPATSPPVTPNGLTTSGSTRSG